MILLKAINPRLYMKGTKAWKLQVQLWLGLVGYSTIITAPLVYYFYNKGKPIREEKLRQKEEAERLKLQQITQVYEELQIHSNKAGMSGMK